MTIDLSNVQPLNSGTMREVYEVDAHPGRLIKIVDEKGDLAPTLLDVIRRGEFGDKHRRAVDRFVAQCKALHLVLGDIHLGNVAYTEARNGHPEIVCIDGFGEKTLIPVHRLSKRLNARRIDRVFKRLPLPVDEAA